MDSLGILIAGVLMVALVHWTLRNDGVRSLRDQSGLFRQRIREAPPAAPPSRIRRRAPAGPK